MHHRVPDWMIWTFLLLVLAAASLPVYERIGFFRTFGEKNALSLENHSNTFQQGESL